MTQAVSIHRSASNALVVLILATLTIAAIQAPVAEAQNLPAAVYTVEGYVYDNQAVPLKDATVSIYPAGGGNPTSAVTDANGKYSIASVAAGTYNASASAPNLVVSFVPIQVGGADSRIQQSFLLRAPDQQVYGQPMNLRGIVRDDASGAPMGDVAIEIWNYYYPKEGYSYGYPSNSEQRQTVRSAADGSYSAVLSEGSINLMVRKDGYDALHANFEIRTDRALDLPMMKSTTQSITISGTVTDIDGTPLPDAWVNVQPDYRCEGGNPNMGCAYPMPYEQRSQQEGDVYFYYEPSVSQYNSTMTDQDGAYEMRTMPGKLLVLAQANEHIQKQVSLEATSGEKKTADFELEKIPADSVRVFGRVIDTETGQAISWAQLNLENQKWGHYNYTQTKEDGSFEFWTKPGYTIVTASAHQWYYAPCEQQMDPASSPESDKSSGASAPEPYYSRAPCEQGERDREYMTRVFTIDAQADQSEELEFKLIPRPVPDAVFQGYVVNKTSEKGVPGAYVSFYNELTRDYGQAVTDQDGSYKITVHGGYYTVRASAQGFFDVVQNADIRSDETKRLDLLASPGERNYGYCCYTYASHGSDGYAVKESSMGPSGGGGYATASAQPMAPAPAMGVASDQDSARAAGAPSSGGQQAYVGEGGGLGPYSPAGEQEPGGKAPGAGIAVLVIAALAAVFLGRRRE
ncbi:MAG TPA: carboxypeptidase regulatory-like domain-containing protein [Candidatus Thermoplasmatota archaeon]